MADKNQDIIQKLKSDKLKPVYFIHGTEIFYLDAMTQKIIDIAIPDFEKSFNEYILYGKDVSFGDVLNYARKFPMMAERQLVVVKEAHQISDINNKDVLALVENYAKNPLPSTILVLCFGKAQDERKTWVKAFAEKGQLCNFKKMNDYEVPDFILAHCSNLNLKISPKAVQLLTEHVGNNLQAIHNEIDKIKINLKNNEAIDADTVERYVGISKDYNVFELQKALLERNAMKSYKIVQYFASNAKDHPIQSNIIILYNFFSKVLLLLGNKNANDSELAKILGVNPYFLKDYKKASFVFPISHLMRIISTIRMVDQKSKGIDAGSMDEGQLYQDLVFNILH